MDNKTLLEEIAILVENDLKISMYEPLSVEIKEQLKNDLRDSAESDYNKILFTQFNNLILMNIIMNDKYCGLYSRGSKARYTLNLSTFKPTKNSNMQNQPSSKLVDKIKIFMENNNINNNNKSLRFTLQKINNIY